MAQTGLSPAEAWALTLPEFVWLQDALVARERREDFRFGQVCAVLANVNRDKKRRNQAYKPGDFFASLKTVAAPGEQTPAAMLAKLELLTAVFGGQDLRAGEGA